MITGPLDMGLRPYRMRLQDAIFSGETSLLQSPPSFHHAACRYSNMVALILAFLLPLLQGPTLAEVDAARDALRPFLDALATVESNGKDDAIGDNGNALGRYQLWQVYWQDAVDYCPDIEGRYKDVTNKVYAERCVVAYLMRYCPKAVAASDYEVMARTHNGGPKGSKRKATIGYWKKVGRALESR